MRMLFDYALKQIDFNLSLLIDFQKGLNIFFIDPPKISPFMFSSELTEGSSVQVLCGVSSGDKPVYFSWLKDGSPIPPNLQVFEFRLRIHAKISHLMR